MERRIDRFLFTSCILTILIGLSARATSASLKAQCDACFKKGNSGCGRLCASSGRKRSGLSDGFNTLGGYDIIQANPRKRTNNNQQCSLPQLYNLVPSECAETLDMLVEWASRGLRDDQ